MTTTSYAIGTLMTLTESGVRLSPERARGLAAALDALRAARARALVESRGYSVTGGRR